MTTSTLEGTQRLKFKRIGSSDYALTIDSADGSDKINLRVIGHYVPASEGADVRNGWVWTAFINGQPVDAPTTLTRKRDAINLLQAKLDEMAASIAKAKKAAADNHKTFRRSTNGTKKAAAPTIIDHTVRVKGTTLIGTVTALTQGDKERLRIATPEGYNLWALREVTEEVKVD